MFENDVKEYGIQTRLSLRVDGRQFENDVKEYGIQTAKVTAVLKLSLRMM